jgi:hypothetical protein
VGGAENDAFLLHLPPLSAALFWDLAGGLWLAGLWYVAPAICGNDRGAVARTAGVGVLGIGIPFGLGICDLLYAPALWLALAAIATVRIRRCGWFDRRDGAPATSWDVPVLICVLVAIAWPAAVRPLMDGDSLSYHLPNAASWVVHHGVWTTGTRYWWYPSGSELFASGLLAAGGPALVGLSGLVPALVLGLRLRSIAVANGNHPLLGTAIACALLATSVASSQVVSLQNDLWLAAFFLEALVGLGPASLAVAALVKPYGFVLAAVAAALRRVDGPIAVRLLAFVPLAIWAVRDLALLAHALVPPASTWYADSLGTSIAAHLPSAFGVLASAAWGAGPVWALLMLIATAAIGFAHQGWLRWAAFASLALFLLVPFGYTNDVPQLASGQSLRYALPFVAIGAAALCMLRGRYVVGLIPVALLGAVAGIAQLWQLYWNDATTHDVRIVLLLAAAVAAGVSGVRVAGLRSALGAMALCLGVVWSAGLAGERPSAYLADRYGVAGAPAGAFDAFRATTFARVVAVRLPAGAATLIRPGVDAYDAEPADACALAHALRAGLLIALPAGSPGLACGPALFRDTTSALIAP